MSGETFKIFILSRDGKEVMRGSEFAVLDFIHNRHSFSMDHAIKYEGYSVTPAWQTKKGLILSPITNKEATMPVRPKCSEDRSPTRPTRQKGPTPQKPATQGSSTQRRKANKDAHKRGASTK